MTDLVDTPAPLRTGLVIGGRTIGTDDAMPVHDPAAPATVVGYAAAATPDQARAAVTAADDAFPGWAALSGPRRAELLLAAVERLADTAAERAAVLVRENGKVAFEARLDIDGFAHRCRAAAALVEESGHVPRYAGPPLTSEVHALPMGVVTIIVPFNWPLAILAASLPYSLLAGNTVVVKPPPTAPLATVATLEQLSAALPPGVLNVVTGANDAVAPLLTDPRVSKIVFTGSTAAGRRIMRAAAENLTSVTLELGGNDPAILLDDVELDTDTVHRLALAAFLTSGQVCMAVKRVHVHRSRYAELVAALTAELDRIVVGPGTDPTSTMGPLHTAAQRERVLRMLDEARTSGAEVRELGTAAPAADSGHFQRPALVLDPNPTLAIVTEEQFGPALPILPFDDVETVVAECNNGWSGLSSSVWSADHARARSIALRLRTGTTWINTANAMACDDRVPFGGFRQSGIGREMGPDGLRSFTEPHSITW